MDTRALHHVEHPDDAHPLVASMRSIFPREFSRTVTQTRRSFIYEQGREITHVYFLLSGTAAVERVDEDGRMAMFGIMGPASLLAWQDVLAGDHHRNWAEALSVCEVAAIPRDAFSSALRSYGQLADILMRQTAAQLNAYEDHMLRLSTLELSQRVYATLCSFADKAAADDGLVELNVPLLQRDLAALLGSTPESISRSLRRLEDLRVAEFLPKNRIRLRLGWNGNQ